MYQLVKLLEYADNPWIKELLELFAPLLQLLALDAEFYQVQLTEFQKINASEKRFPIHPFHRWFPHLLKNGIILNSLAVYDTIRDLFLSRIPLQSPNCLTQCPNNYACCHGNYSIERIDYERIIASGLTDPSWFFRSRGKYKIKLEKDENRRTFCSALEISTKKCRINQFKPPTCCKYPLISNIQTWSKDLTAWTGNCAHCDVLWATRVHPAIMNGCRDLWVSSNLLWDSEQHLFSRVQGSLTAETREILSLLLAIQQVNWPYSSVMAKKILLEDYPESAIHKAFLLIKK